MWGLAKIAPDLSLRFPGQVFLTGLLAALSFFIVASALAAFLKAKTTVHPIKLHKSSALVTDGLYKFSRNPMYLAMLFALLAWGAYLGHPFGIIGPIGFIFVMNRLQIEPEEKALETLFGEDYRLYKSRVRRWL